MEFKDKLKELRKKNDLTQTAVADKIFVSRSAIAKWENGLGLPSYESLDLLCNFFNVSKDELICNEPEEEKNVKKNRIIFKQRGFILGLISSILILIIAIILIIIIFPRGKIIEHTYNTYYAPAISINESRDYYYTNCIEYEDEYIATKNILLLETDEIKNLNSSSKNDIYNLNIPLCDKIEVFYYYLTDDYLYMNMDTFEPYTLEEIEHLSNWYNDTIYKNVEVNNNIINIPTNEYKNLIRLDLTIDGHFFQYFFLFQ